MLCPQKNNKHELDSNSQGGIAGNAQAYHTLLVILCFIHVQNIFFYHCDNEND